MDRNEVAEWLGVDDIVPGSVGERIAEALSGPLDLTTVALIPGFDELTDHDREEIARFAAMVNVIGPPPVVLTAPTEAEV